MATLHKTAILLGVLTAFILCVGNLLGGRAGMARWSAFFGGVGGNDDEGGMGIFGLIAMSIIAPLAAMLIQMAISRSREYLADSTGAHLARHAEGLASALEKIGACSARRPMRANPATAHMFIASPLSGGGLAGLFSTHPPLEEKTVDISRSKDRRFYHPGNGPSDPCRQCRSILVRVGPWQSTPIAAFRNSGIFFLTTG